MIETITVVSLNTDKEPSNAKSQNGHGGLHVDEKFFEEKSTTIQGEVPITSSVANLVSTDPAAAHSLQPEAEPEVFPDDEHRISWGGKLEFILTCIGFAVGLGNVWRFPYLCGKNGGGAFLIPFTIMLVIVGIPVVFLEISFGQFASLGPVTIWKATPLFRGVGYAAVSITWLLVIYYNVIVAWTAHFIVSSVRSKLLWADCDQPWTTDRCMDKDKWDLVKKVSNWTNGTEILRNMNITLNDTATPSEEYFYRHVLKISQGMEEMGEPQWQLVLCLLFAWTVIFLVLWKGIQSLGKVAYFTTIFPYILLTVMLVRAVTLPGAGTGLLYYITPQWHRLADAEVWSDAATQIFYSLSACGGGLIAMASFNKFNNNTLRDAVIVSVVSYLTCLYAGAVVFAFLGYIAYTKGATVESVASASGPGLVFVVYPEGLSQMPLAPLWSVLFFIMLMTIGFSSSFSNVETVFTAILDEIPLLKEGRRPIYFRGVGCFCLFLLGIPMVTRGGYHLFQIMDTNVGGYPMLIVGIIECIVLGWVYGYDHFKNDLELMLGVRISVFWKLMWCFASPALLIVTVTLKAIQHTPMKTIFGREYPPFAQALSWCIMAFSMFWIPFHFLYRYCKSGGIDLLRDLANHEDDWGPRLREHCAGRYVRKSSTASALQAMQLRGPIEPQIAYDNYAAKDILENEDSRL